MDEFVVVGYGVQKKSHITGSVAKVKNVKLDQEPVSRIDEALVGKMAGVNITNANGAVGQAPTIRIRGNSSVTTASDPLIVVDGVPVSSDFLTTIDMNDVESFEVLKDAASAAIYGSRAAAGVIMITTKQGKAGKTKFSFNAYSGIKSAVSTESPVPTVSEWASWVRQQNGGPTSEVTRIEAIGTEQNWAETMFDGGNIQSYNLRASGGNDKINFMASGGYMKDEGVLLTDDFEKYNLRLNLNAKVNDVVSVGFSAAPSYSNTRRFPIGVHDAIRQSPWLPIYHDAHTLQYVVNPDFDPSVGDYAMERHFTTTDSEDPNYYFPTTSNANAYAKVVERNYQDRLFNLLTSGYLKLNLMEGLEFKSSIAVEYQHLNTEDWDGVLADRRGASRAGSSLATRSRTHWVNENYFTYNKTSAKHDVNLVAGFSAEKTNVFSSNLDGSGYSFDYIRLLKSH